MNGDERRRIMGAAMDNFKLATDFTNVDMTGNEIVAHHVNLSIAASLLVIADRIDGLTPIAVELRGINDEIVSGFTSVSRRMP